MYAVNTSKNIGSVVSQMETLNRVLSSRKINMHAIVI